MAHKNELLNDVDPSVILVQQNFKGVHRHVFLDVLLLCLFFISNVINGLDGELNVLDDILTEAPDQDDELYNPESEHGVSEMKGIAI